MSNYKVGDEVLVRAVVVHPRDSVGDVVLTTVCVNNTTTRLYCAPSEIVGLASEFTRQEWVRTDERLPEHAGYFWWTMHEGATIPELGLYISKNFEWCDDVKPVAWMPVTRPAPYVPPYAKWGCSKCVHEAVCVYRQCGDDGGFDNTCGGAHYAEKGE